MNKEIVDLACGNWYTQMLYAVCVLEIADKVGEGKDIATLASETGTNEDALYRLLRALSTKGIFSITPDALVTNTERSRLLSMSHPSCLSSICIMRGQRYQYQSWSNLMHSLKTGASALEHTLGMSMFEWLLQHPDQKEYFDRAMASITREVGKEIATNHMNLFPERSIIVDVGGGKGELLSHILPNTESYGFVLDLQWCATPPHPRISFLEGSFFDKLNTHADVFILKYILHDWSDEKCVQILSNVRDAMTQSTQLQAQRPYPRLLIIESLLDDDYHKVLDMQMLVCLETGARERTYTEYEKLLNTVGLQIANVHKLKTLNLSILEVTL